MLEMPNPFTVHRWILSGNVMCSLAGADLLWELWGS